MEYRQKHVNIVCLLCNVIHNLSVSKYAVVWSILVQGQMSRYWCVRWQDQMPLGQFTFIVKVTATCSLGHELHTQMSEFCDSVHKLPLCAGLRKRHINCKVSQILFRSIAFLFGTDGCQDQHKAMWTKSNKIKQHQKIFLKHRIAHSTKLQSK